MPTSKTFEIQCSATQAQQLAEAIQTYAHAAYPPGGSECAQVSREALLEAAKAILQQHGETITLRKRQRSMLQTAINWFYNEEGPGDPGLAKELTALFKRR